MTGSAQYASQRVIVCCICAGPVPLETSKTDERGKAVHGDSYRGRENPDTRAGTVFRVMNGYCANGGWTATPPRV